MLAGACGAAVALWVGLPTGGQAGGPRWRTGWVASGDVLSPPRGIGPAAPAVAAATSPTRWAGAVERAFVSPIGGLSPGKRNKPDFRNSPFAFV